MQSGIDLLRQRGDRVCEPADVGRVDLERFSVEVDGGARDVGAARRDQERDQIRVLLGLADASEREPIGWVTFGGMRVPSLYP